MKKFLGLILILSFFACKKGDTGPTGPAGAQGPAGPQGPTGVAGNANVTQYTYGIQDLTLRSFVQLQVTTTLDTMNRSQWFCVSLLSAFKQVVFRSWLWPCWYNPISGKHGLYQQ